MERPAPNAPSLQLTIGDEALTPLVERIVRQVLEQQQGRLAYTESEAAELIGVAAHVLRDCRLRGEITGTRAGKKTLYSRAELMAFLRRRENA